MVSAKLCLVFPRFRYISGDPPMGVGYLASYLKKIADADVSIIDTTFMRSFENLFIKLREIKPNVVGIYSDNVMAQDAIKIADWARNNRLYTIFGGPQPSVLPETFINYADVVVRGEGELILAEIIKRYNNNIRDLSGISGIWWKRNGDIVKNPSMQNFVNLDDLFFPERALLPMDKYLYYWNYLDALDPDRQGTTMIVSRGCPFSCSYCQPTISQMFGAKIRIRSPRNVVDEMVLLKTEYKIDGIFFHDDTFTLDHNWLKEFCRIVINEGVHILWGCNSRVDTVNEDILKMMYQAGLRNIHFGIESASQKILDNIYNKKIKVDRVREVISLANKIGIYCMGFFMLGAPTETEKDINDTISFAKGLRLQEASFFLTTPLAGTYLYSMISNNNRYGINIDYQNSNYYSQYSISGGLNRKKIKFLQLKAFFVFYLHPYRLRYIIKYLFSIKGINKLLTKIKKFS